MANLTYNLTNISQQTNLLGLTQQLDLQLGGMYSWGLMLTTFAIIFITFLSKKVETKTAFTTSCFICFSLATLLYMVNLVSIYLIVIFVLGTAGGIAVMFSKDDGTGSL